MATNGAASDYLENKILDHVMRVSAYTQPTSLEIALFDITSSEALLEQGTLTGEISGNGYARKTLTNEFSNPASGGTITNSGTIVFNQATGAWPDVHRAAILDQLGNVLYYGTLDTPVSVGNGDTFQFNPSNWTVNAD